MSEFIRARLLLAKYPDDTEPTVCAAVDEVIWEHWTDAEEAAWFAAGKRAWGLDSETEFKVVVARFAPQDLADAFATPEIFGEIEEGRAVYVGPPDDAAFWRNAKIGDAIPPGDPTA